MNAVRNFDNLPAVSHIRARAYRLEAQAYRAHAEADRADGNIARAEHHEQLANAYLDMAHDLEKAA